MTQEPHKKPDPYKPLVFGKTFTDHMLMVEWNEKKGWGQPRIQPFQNLMLHPACSGLHYSLQVAWLVTSLPVSLPVFLLLCLSLDLPPWVRVSSFWVFTTHFLRPLMFQTPCWVMLGSPR